MEVIRAKDPQKTDRKVWFDKLFIEGNCKEVQIIRVVVEPGARSPLEGAGVHEDEYDFIVRGSTVMEIGDERVTLNEGDIVHIPDQVPHVGYNETDEICEILTVVIQK